VQLFPQREPLRLSQFQHRVVHRVKSDVFPGEAVVTSLQSDALIPHGRRDQQLVPQLLVFLVGALPTVFVPLSNRDRIGHAFGAPNAGGAGRCFLIDHPPLF
jgi:hypothetical protein